MLTKLSIFDEQEEYAKAMDNRAFFLISTDVQMEDYKIHKPKLTI